MARVSLDTKIAPHGLRLLGVALLAAALLTGCGLLSGNSSGSYEYSGSWRGTVTDDAGGTGAFIVTLSQANLALTGTWHVVMGGDPARASGGNWAGQVFIGQDKDLLEANLAPAVAGQCAYRLTLSRNNDALTGDYTATGAAASCDNMTRGSISLSKQQ